MTVMQKSSTKLLYGVPIGGLHYITHPGGALCIMFKNHVRS